MIVVFDTTETYTDLRMEGPSFQLLKAYLNRTSSTLAVPAIVFEETVNHFRERLAKNVRTAVDNIREIGNLTGTKQSDVPPMLNQDEAIRNYRQHLESQISSMSGKVIGFEKVNVGDLVQRSLQRRKPFDGEGRKGFRDAVIWETILQELLAVNSKATVALITKNTSDFGKDGVLEDSLVEECTKVGRACECVKLFNGLQEFIQTEVKPHLETLDTIREQLQEGQYLKLSLDEFLESAYDVVRDNLRSRVKYFNSDQLSYTAMIRFRSPHLHSLDWRPMEVKVADVWSIDDEKVAVGVDFTVDGEIECLEQNEGYYPEGDEIFSEFYDRAFVGDARFKVFMTVILDKKTGETGDCEINEVETELTGRWR